MGSKYVWNWLEFVRIEWKFSDPESVKIWCQTRAFGVFQVVSSCLQMRFVMGNWFECVRSGPKVIFKSFNIIGHRLKQSWITKFMLRPISIHLCVLWFSLRKMFTSWSRIRLKKNHSKWSFEVKVVGLWSWGRDLKNGLGKWSSTLQHARSCWGSMFMMP